MGEQPESGAEEQTTIVAPLTLLACHARMNLLCFGHGRFVSDHYSRAAQSIGAGERFGLFRAHARQDSFARGWETAGRLAGDARAGGTRDF